MKFDEDDIMDDLGRPARDAYPLIPEEVYEVNYVGYDRKDRVFAPNEGRIFLRYKVVSIGPYMGTPLFQAFKSYDRWPPRSKYYQNWSIANGARPRSITRMSPGVFKNKVFRAQVRTVVPKYESGPLKGKPKPEIFHYSIVDELLEVVVGGSVQRSVTSDQLSVESNQGSVTSEEYLATTNKGYGK